MPRFRRSKANSHTPDEWGVRVFCVLCYDRKPAEAAGALLKKVEVAAQKVDEAGLLRGREGTYGILDIGGIVKGSTLIGAEK